jgi:hypothetical protein
MKQDTRTSTRARRACALGFSVVVTGIAGLHAYWALGGSWGIYEGSGRNFPAGESLSLGWRLGTWGLVVLLLAAAILVLVRTGIVPLRMPRFLVVGGCWVVAIVMLGVAIGDFGGSSTWSRAVFAPAALVLSALVVVVATPSRRTTRLKALHRSEPTLPTRRSAPSHRPTVGR